MLTTPHPRPTRTLTLPQNAKRCRRRGARPPLTRPIFLCRLLGVRPVFIAWAIPPESDFIASAGSLRDPTFFMKFAGLIL